MGRGAHRTKSLCMAKEGATPAAPTLGRRQLFALAAAFAATILTAGAAIAGLTRTASSTPPAQIPTVSQVVAPTAPAFAEPVEPGG